MLLTPISVSETTNTELESSRYELTKLLPQNRISEGRQTMPDNKINMDLLQIGREKVIDGQNNNNL